MKISIIGAAGTVGSCTAFSIAIGDLAEEIVMLDTVQNRLTKHVNDLNTAMTGRDIVIRQGKDVIFVREDSLAIWKYVTVEFESSTSLSIKEGLEPGDLVIVSGNVNLAHETIVREE